MTDLAPLFSAAEQKYNLPPGILAATAKVESSLNPRAVSPQGAEGLMQLMPATAQGLSADPMNVPQAIDGAARLWQQNLQASGGDIDRAAMMYHGGNDPRNWGPKTQAYPAKLAAALGPAPQAQEGGDPIEAALSGQAPTQSAPPSAPADPHDPIEAALAGTSQDRQAEIAQAQATAARQLQAGDEQGAIATLAQHNLQPAPGEIAAFHAGKRTPGFHHVDSLPDQSQPPQTNQALGFIEGLAKPIDNAATWLQEGAQKIGLDKPIDALGSALGLPSLQQANANQQSYFNAQQTQGQTPGKLGEFAGEVAGTVPAAVITKNPWIAGGLSGALTTNDPNNLKQTALDTALGAIGGKATHAITGAVAGTIAPKVSAAVQALNDLGVQMTPGQIVGGALRRIEDAATSIPLLGDLVKNAQRRSIISLNSGVINDRVLGPIGKTLPAGVAGREAVDYADNAVSSAYHDLLPQLTLRGDQQLGNGISDILQTTSELPPDRATQVQTIIKNTFGPKFGPDWSMSGQSFKEADAKVGQLAREYSSSADPEQRKMGGIFRDVQGEFRAALQRSNPEQAPQLNNINQAFANLVRVEGAASSAGAKGGIATPAQLGQAVRRFDSTIRKKGYATGKALLQDISDPAQEVLPQSLPDSGTPYRTLLAYALGAGAGATAKVAAPATLPLALYTKAGQRAFQKVALAPRSPATQALAKALTKMKAPLAVAGGAASAEAANGR